ncbi:hypothetical protein Hanom_Chr11g00991091 [Helianthus anomalus]
MDGVNEPDEDGKISNLLDPDAEKQTFGRNSQKLAIPQGRKWHFTLNRLNKHEVTRIPSVHKHAHGQQKLYQHQQHKVTAPSLASSRHLHLDVHDYCYTMARETMQVTTVFFCGLLLKDQPVVVLS